MIGGAVAGHAIGKKQGVRHGALIGIGAGFMLANRLKHDDIVVKRGTILHLKLRDAITTVG